MLIEKKSRGRPKLEKKKEKVINIRIEFEIAEKLEKIAKNNERDLSKQIRLVLRKFVENQSQE